MDTGGRCIAVDVETTGFSPNRGGRVIEVGAVVIENGVCKDEFHTLIDAGAPIASGAFRVHGISHVMLRGQPQPSEVWCRFQLFIGDSPLIAHNSSFDSSFVGHELGLLGYRLPNRWHCTVKLARKHLPHLPNHKLETVSRHLFPDLPSDLRLHRSIDDARLAARIWLALSRC